MLSFKPHAFSVRTIGNIDPQSTAQFLRTMVTSGLIRCIYSKVHTSHGKVPQLKQGRSHGESEGTNSACDFLFDTRFAHAACHCFNSGALLCTYD